ncbi:M23 family metallopeptidase (plasmid) [Acaryochloris sp. 'Moss Beach']|uniref:M23 family metallopeptidase n=1 Tax=Acaryochloris TaxID=155977 RepID=UPI001BAEE448|nr:MULTISPECIES: M23 family metallopeptidase [Acaryochloris]QUY45886.1 M23 family metallopeptidase [Acaryochloris marina S15]UJB72467.1 M23 family metallopeptidase [Acaryochloris sp. 'Moss Beach']
MNLKAGDYVTAGQLIGYSGNSDWSSGPHLHVKLQKPSQRQHFTKTVPFAISGTCKEEPFAQK